ncbi:MAG: YciI family protein [Actinobacteria bacterium]|nr:YciI family protein [Actinomycetota bacterium]
MPKYAALIYSDAADEQRQPSPEEMQQVMTDYMEFGRNAGSVIVGGEALHPTATATTIHVEGGKGGKALFTDGPFAESKEVLGGFYLLDCADLDEALRWAQQIPGAWHGKVEVRPVMEFNESG